MASEEDQDLLDAEIERLLRATARQDGDASAEARQQQDRQRLRRLSVGNSFPDTLVIVRFPVTNLVDCDGYKWETKELFLDSHQLLATGSSVFAAQLSPEAQEQTRRRLDYASKKYPHARNAKYILDLTPPIEGVELASLIIQMSLSDGLRDWWRSCYVSSVPKSIVSGHDDVCPKHTDLVLSGYALRDALTRGVKVSELEYPESRKTVDYCPIRHRAAILRLLMAISKGDLVLDSAPRTATLIVVAKYFDCVKVVKESVLAWFMADTNQEFIQTNAEDALWMGWMMELPQITRMAFRILVVERAIEILDNKRFGVNSKRQPSILGRSRGSVTDEQETCIQHAAQKLAQRASTLYTQLISDNAHELLGIRHWPRSDLALCRTLRTYIRRLVYDARMDTSTGGESFISTMIDYDESRARYVPAAALTPTKEIYLGLSAPQSILTCTFWRRLSEVASMPENLHPYVNINQKGADPRGRQYRAPFDRNVFHSEFLDAILGLCVKWTRGNLEINVPKNGFLIFGLSDEEFRFLPVWAGGLDDGTGSVFQPEIPDADRGVPIGPGPAFITGETIADDRSSTITGGSWAPTVISGIDTFTITSGHSMQPAYSQTTGPGELAARLRLTTAGPDAPGGGAAVSGVPPSDITSQSGFNWALGAGADADSSFDDNMDYESTDNGPSTPTGDREEYCFPSDISEDYDLVSVPDTDTGNEVHF